MWIPEAACHQTVRTPGTLGQPRLERGQVDQHVKLHHRLAARGDGGEQRFDLELLPGQSGAGLGAGLPALLVDRGPQLSVADGIDSMWVCRIPVSRSVHRRTFDISRCLSSSSASLPDAWIALSCR